MKGRAVRLGLVVFAAAFALRAGWVIYRWECRGAELTFDDERLHWELATNLVRDGVLVTDDGRYAARMPLYPFFLALFAGGGEAGILAARLGQAAVGGLTAVVALGLAWAAFGPRGGLLTAGLVCVDPFGVFFSNLLLTETIFSLLAAGFLAVTWWAALASRGAGSGVVGEDAREAPRAGGRRDGRDEQRLDNWRGRKLLSAPVIGIALLGPALVLTRPSALGWVMLVWVVLMVADSERWRAVMRTGGYVLVLALALLPWGLRNRAVLGAPAWLSTNGGITLYDAQGPQARGDSDQSFLARMPELSGLGEVERDAALRRLALEQMRRDPGRVMRLAWGKLLRTWSLRPNYGPYRSGASAVASLVYTLGALLLAMIGVVRAARVGQDEAGAAWRGWRLVVVLVLVGVIYFTAVHMVYVGSVRYRVPLMPLLAVLAGSAAGLGAGWERCEKRRGSPDNVGNSGFA